MRTLRRRSARPMHAPKIKRDIYMISAFLTALAGTFYTQYIYFIDPATAFSFSVSIEAALVSIVGVNRHVVGPVIGTVLLEPRPRCCRQAPGSSVGGIQLTVYSLDPDRRHPVAANHRSGETDRTASRPKVSAPRPPRPRA